MVAHRSAMRQEGQISWKICTVGGSIGGGAEAAELPPASMMAERVMASAVSWAICSAMEG